MKRTAQGTIRLAKTLVKEGYPSVTPRRLERWSVEDLGPLGTPDYPALVRHYAELASLSSTGRDADTVARRLAARGFPCGRLRGAILRELGIPSDPPAVIPPALCLASGPSSDPAFAAIEQLARAMMSDPRGLPPLVIKVVRAVYRNTARREAEFGEPAEAIFHSFVVNCLVHLMGDDYYNGDALEAVFGLERGTISLQDMDIMNSKLRMSMPALDDAYRTVPLEEIAFMAQRLTGWAPHLLGYLEVTGVGQDEIEDVAVVLAPAAAHYVSLLRKTFDDFPDEPIPLPPPARELSPAASE